MSNSPNWITKFEISESLKSEYEKSPKQNQESFLVWCLENGHVDEHEYLAWASNEFQIPVVSDAFFVNENAKTKWRASWTTSRFLHQWNPSLLPLDENEECVRVGCIEVPDLKLEKAVIYVLAPLSGLKSLWSEAFPKPAPEPQPVIEPKPLVEPQAVVEALPPSEQETRPVIVLEKVEVPPVEPQTASVDLPPPPASDEFDPNSLMASWGAAQEETPQIPEGAPASEQEPEQAPEGLAMPEGLSAATDGSSAIDIPIPSISAENVPIPTMAAKAPEPPPVPQTPVIVETAAPTPIAEVKAKNPPIPPMAAASSKVTGDLIGLVELRDPKEKFEDCNTVTELAVSAFSKFSRYFDRHILVLLKGFELRPHAWAGNWNLRSAKPNQVNTEAPGIFRIVFRTQLPYHGYVKPSPSNDLFFAEWNNGSIPVHTTVMPLLVNGQLVGMLLGATDGTLDVKIALTDAERWVRDLAPHLARVKTAAPQAA